MLAIRVSAARMDDDGYVLVCTDYTALRRAEQHFETVVTSLGEGVIIIGRDGTVTSANPAAKRILGVRVVDAFDLPILDAEGQPVAGRADLVDRARRRNRNVERQLRSPLLLDLLDHLVQLLEGGRLIVPAGLREIVARPSETLGADQEVVQLISRIRQRGPV